MLNATADTRVHRLNQRALTFGCVLQSSSPVMTGTPQGVHISAEKYDISKVCLLNDYNS